VIREWKRWSHVETSSDLQYVYRFVTVTVMSTKHSTPVLKKNLNPDYEPKDATFDFPLYLSTAEKLGAAEFVVWDKDMFSKEYLGEASLMLNDWFPHGRALGFTDPTNEVSWTLLLG
jgi:phosphatidylserine decarboxylase